MGAQFYVCRAIAGGWVCAPASRRQNVYWVQLYEAVRVGDVLEALKRGNIKVAEKGGGLYEVLLPVKFRVRVLDASGARLADGEIARCVAVKLVANRALASFAENIVFAREIEKYVEELSKKRLKIKPNHVVKILEDNNVVMFYGATDETGKLLANRSKAIETLKKRKNWKGWLGVGLHVGRKKYVEMDLYSDGRMAVISKDGGAVQDVISWLSSVLFTSPP